MRTLTLLIALISMATVGCGQDNSSAAEEAAPSTGPVKIDGSSTVFPITEAVAEEFGMKDKARVTIGVSGTGGGFKKFCAGEIDVTGASRYIKSSEQALCTEGGSSLPPRRDASTAAHAARSAAVKAMCSSPASSVKRNRS